MNPRSHHTGSPGKDTADPALYDTTQVYPLYFNLENLDERDLPAAQSPVAQVVRNRGHG